MSNNKQQTQPENPNNQFSNTEPLTHAQRVAIANKMSNYKQSSVEWLVDKLFPNNDNIRFLCPKEILEQAKAMHKEEHLKTYNQGLMSNFQNFDDYYNETFG